MKKLVFIGLALVLAITLGAGLGLAGDNIPSTKSAFYWDSIDVVYPDSQVTPGWTEIFPDEAVRIKTGTPKDLIITVSAECVLATTTRLTADVGEDSAAEIRIRVSIADAEGNFAQWAYPTGTGDGVTFASRLIELKGHLSGQYECDDPLTPLVIELCPDWIELFMQTKTANAFSFVAEDVGSGIHEVVVEAYLDASGPTTKNPKGDDPVWFAMIGHSSVVVDEVNLKTLPTT